MAKPVQLAVEEARSLGISSGNRVTWEALIRVSGDSENPVAGFQEFAIAASYQNPDFILDPEISKQADKNRQRNYDAAQSKFVKLIDKLGIDTGSNFCGPVAHVNSTGINGLLRDRPVWLVQSYSEQNQKIESYGVATVKLRENEYELVYVLLDGIEYQKQQHWASVVRDQYKKRSPKKMRSMVEVSSSNTTKRIFTYKDNLLSLTEYREHIRAEHKQYETNVLGVPDGKSCWHSDTKEDHDSRVNAAIRARMLLIDENTAHKHTKANGFLYSDRSLMALHDRFKSWPECIMFVQADGILLGYISGAPITSEKFLWDTRIGSDSMNYNLPPEVIYWKDSNQNQNKNDVKAFCFSSIRLSEHGIDLLFENSKYKDCDKSDVAQQVGNLLLAGAKKILEKMQERSEFNFSRLYLFMHQQFVKEWYLDNVDEAKTLDYCRVNSLPNLYDEKESSITIGRIILSKECLKTDDLLSLKGKKPATFHASYVSNR